VAAIRRPVALATTKPKPYQASFCSTVKRLSAVLAIRKAAEHSSAPRRSLK